MSGTSAASALSPIKTLSRSLRAHAVRGRTGNPYTDLFFISFAILFLELACIRWFGSTVLFLTFFTNLVLFACFLGMSVGLLATGRRADLDRGDSPGDRRPSVLAELTSWAYAHFGSLSIDVGGQASPQQVFFGAETQRGDLSRFVVPIECVAALFFAVIALMFVGLGQAMGRPSPPRPDRVPPTRSTSSGSLAGIACFTLVSYCQTSRRSSGSPSAWRRSSASAGVSGPALRLLACWSCSATAATRDGGRFLTFWSPYYKVTYQPAQRDDRDQPHRPPGASSTCTRTARPTPSLTC